MKYWLKYRRNSSASAGNWEWKMLYSDAFEEAKSETEELANEINESYYWSEHHRGVEWEILTEAPKHVVEKFLISAKHKIDSLMLDIVRLEGEATTSNECECTGKSEHSSYCDICGRILKKVVKT